MQPKFPQGQIQKPACLTNELSQEAGSNGGCLLLPKKVIILYFRNAEKNCISHTALLLCMSPFGAG